MTTTEDATYAADSAALDELPAGARVVIRLPNGHRLADILLGCFDRELVAVPLHPKAGDADLAAGAARVAAAAVVDAHGVRRTGLPDAHPTPEAPALIMFT
ncbi:long-chain fatty acid--CoA ligase, partial [Streptomyces sp. RCU064]|nr:long-chain fatty acid--CoA ligase [Streptomyces rugosispiralis]